MSPRLLTVAPPRVGGRSSLLSGLCCKGARLSASAWASSVGVWELVGVASFAFERLRGTKDRRGRLSGTWRPLIWVACTSAVSGGKMKQRWRKLDEEKGACISFSGK